MEKNNGFTKQVHNSNQPNNHLFFFQLGQILNRFSRDIFLMDDELPWKSYDAVMVSHLLALLS